MKRYFNWFFVDGIARQIWDYLACTIVALLPVLVKHGTRPSAILTGFIFQFLGVSTVIIGLMKTQREFSQTGLLQAVKSWWDRRPWKKHEISVAVGATTGQATASGIGRVLRGSAPGAPLEARIEALERSLADIYSEIDGDRSDIKNKFNMLFSEIKKESHARELSASLMDQRLVASQTSNLSNSLVGAAWLIVGIAIDTFV